MSEWRVLAVLDSYGDRSITELAVETKLPQPTVTHTVARLEERGDVERQRSDTDGRQRIVALTPSGTAMVTSLIERARQREDDVFAGLGVARDELRDGLRQLIKTIEAPS